MFCSCTGPTGVSVATLRRVTRSSIVNFVRTIPSGAFATWRLCQTLLLVPDSYWPRRSRCRPTTSVWFSSDVKANHRPRAISDRKPWIALDDLLAQRRPLARFPERCRVGDPVAKRTAIGTIAARDRAWDADELGAHFIAGQPHGREAVTARIHECEVRGKCRIGNGVSALQVESLGVFEARANAVLE